MNQLLRGSVQAQKLLVSGVAARLSGVSLHLEATAAAAAAASSPSHWQWRGMSSEPTEPSNEVEEAPKTKRGRPRKVKPEDEQTEAAGVAATVMAGETQSEEPVVSSPGPSFSYAEDTLNISSPLASRSSSPMEQASIETNASATAPSVLSKGGGRRGPRFVQGLATVTAPARIPEQWHSGASLSDIAPGSQGPVGQYIDFPEGTLPESTASFFYDPALAEERVRQSDYGCKGVTAEFAAFGKRSLIHRSVTQNLLDAAATGAPRRIFVDGWTGAGKSVALYTLAAAARATGWVVMYVPSATLLVQGGRFYRSDIEGDALWDTPEAARHVLNAVTRAHGNALASIKAADGSGKKLADVAAEGLGSTVARVIVEAAIAVKDGLMAHDGADGVRTMVVVDDYNALYSHTDYHEPMHAFHRRPIASDELRMATAFRLLEPNNVPSTGAGVAVAAPTFGGGVSKSLRLPRAPDALTVRVPRFGVDDVAVVAAMLAGTGAVQEVPSEHVIRRALALTNGNAKELRELWNVVMVDEDPVGLSLGYKALAAAKVRYATTLP